MVYSRERLTVITVLFDWPDITYFDVRRVPNRCLTPLIHGLLLSKVRYALPLFADIRTNTNDAINGMMSDIQVEINRGLRIVLGVRISDRVSIAELLSRVGVPSVNQLAAEATLMETWKLFNLNLPASSSFIWLDDYSTRTTRNTGKNILSTQPPGGSAAGKFVRNATMLWNIATQDVRSSDDKNYVKQTIRHFARNLPI